MGLLVGQFRLFLTELSAHNTSVVYFQDINLSKSQWILTKFDMCIDIVEICFGIAPLQILSVIVCLFVCVEVLQPSQSNGVMSSAISLPNHMFTGQA